MFLQQASYTPSFGGLGFSLKLGATISGRLVDGETGLPIAGMDVSAGPMDGHHVSWARSDTNGNYMLRGIPDGLIEVNVRGQGYIEARRLVTIREAQDVTNFNF